MPSEARSGEIGTLRPALAQAQTTHRLPSAIMAWRCSGSTNVELIENMARNGLINSARVRDVRSIYRSADRCLTPRPHVQAMRKVDRANYVLDKRDAYEDAPQWVFIPSSHPPGLTRVID